MGACVRVCNVYRICKWCCGSQLAKLSLQLLRPAACWKQSLGSTHGDCDHSCRPRACCYRYDSKCEILCRLLAMLCVIKREGNEKTSHDQCAGNVVRVNIQQPKREDADLRRVGASVPWAALHVPATRPVRCHVALFHNPARPRSWRECCSSALPSRPCR